MEDRSRGARVQPLSLVLVWIPAASCIHPMQLAAELTRSFPGSKGPSTPAWWAGCLWAPAPTPDGITAGRTSAMDLSVPGSHGSFPCYLNH